MSGNIAKKWQEQANYDLETANSMLESSRYLYVLFCCQQAIEKILKAVIVVKKNEMPPRSHQLIRLAEFAEITLEEDSADFFRELSNYYIHSRYPDTLEIAGELLDRTQTEKVLVKSKEVFQWLKLML
ncbi:HEPN domain-containing protein [bacterium]|nr:HEPN domain-containing protein [bacterium]